MRSFILYLVAVLVGSFFEARAQLNYEPYTFVTIAGSAEAGTRDGFGTEARFGMPTGLACDSSGNVYVADPWNCSIRKITPDGEVTTIAGSTKRNLASPDSGSADGPALQARFNHPEGVAVDREGNVLVADTDNHTIRKIDRLGVVSTFAGLAGNRGCKDGVGSEARFDRPGSIAVDSVGTIYVSDVGSLTVRKITPDGSVTTFAGLAYHTGFDDGQGAAARFWTVGRIAIASDHSLLVHAGMMLRKITPDGVVSSIVFHPPLEGGSEIRWFPGIAICADGSAYFVATGKTQILKRSPSGQISIFAGVDGIGAEDGSGAEAQFNYISGIAADPQGNIFVADAKARTIRRITPGGYVSTFAGHAGGLAHGDGFFTWLPLTDGVGQDARIAPQAYSLTFAANGNLQFSDGYGGSIRQITSDGAVTTRTHPGRTGAMAADHRGNFYMSEFSCIRKILPSGSWQTFAGSPTQLGCKTGIGTAARLSPVGLAVDSHNNIFVADSGNFVIRKITPDAVVTTFAGNAPELGDEVAYANHGYQDGPASQAKFYGPDAIAIDPDDNLYVLDRIFVRKISPSGDVSTLAGAFQTYPYTSADGTGPNALLKGGAIAVDNSGNVYFTDDNLIRKITPQGVTTTIAGSPDARECIDGAGASALFFAPSSIAVDSDGVVYVGDSGTFTIRKGFPSATAPSIFSNQSLRLRNGEFGFSLRCRPSQSLVLESSTDLQSWSAVLTNSTVGDLRFADPNGGSSARYYRSRVK